MRSSKFDCSSIIIHSYVEVQGTSIRRQLAEHASLVIDPVISTISDDSLDHPSTIITFSLDAKIDVRLVLDYNRDILHKDAVVRYLASDGKHERLERMSVNHGVFKGHSFGRHQGRTAWSQNGWARVMIYKTGDEPIFEGVFTIDREQYHIQTRSNHIRTRTLKDLDTVERSGEDMVVWRDSQIKEDQASSKARRQNMDATCMFDDLGLVSDFHSADPTVDTTVARDQREDTTLDQILRRQGSNPYGPGSDLISSIGSTEGCPRSARIALVGIATDCTYTRDFDSPALARSNIIQQVNSASQIYESTFNISLQIQNITISDANCPTTSSTSQPWNIDCATDVTLSDRLDLFSRWRGRISDNNAFWTLLSTCNTGSAVGLSWLGQVCRQGSGGGSSGTVAGANVVVRTPMEWLVIAHEIAHIFGAVHDCSLDTCSQQQCCPLSRTTCDANGQYIMNPSTGRGISQFSPCSVGNICSFIGDGTVDDSCLIENTNTTATPSAQCGNGIVEPGEECDCGGQDLCGDNPCCNPTTCLFTTNAVCDFATDECCTQQCQLSDSTDCQGICQDGDCDDPLDPDEPRVSAPGWFEENRTWVIAVAASVGGLVVLAILICCVWRCRKRRTVPVGNPPVMGPAFIGQVGRGQETLPPYVANPVLQQRSARYA